MSLMSAGRPLSVWMRHELIEQLDSEAEKRGINRSQLIITTLKRELPPLPPATS